MRIIGIETSCDETGVALLVDGKIHENRIYSQRVHSKFGGVVPEIASREHTKILPLMFKELIEDTGIDIKDIDGLAVTYGPGLLCCLLIGLNFTKGLSFSLDIPFVGVNHLEAHIYSPFINSEEFSPPFISLLVSGGHTQLIEIREFGNYKVMGHTLDDACGEAFDKVSKLIGLGYPGGPEIQKWAEKGNDKYFDFPLPNPDGFDFSYSGLKTKVLYTYQELNQEEKIRKIPDIAASFQRVAIEALIIKLKRAVKDTGIRKVAVSGGVSANRLLRKRLDEININWAAPDMEYTTDNGAMIASIGYRLLKNNISSELNLRANPNLKLS